MRGLSKFFKPVYANDNDALIPELWAQEALMTLDANLLAANLVHRDFEDEIASYGDVVNAHRPADFTMQRKTDADEVTIQDAQATNVPVPLDQHLHTSFMIKDGEESKSFKSLRDMYLERALMSIAQGVDQVVLAQVYEFLANLQGQIGTSLTGASLIAVREKFNTLKAPMGGRNVILTPSQEGDLLNVDKLITADKVGDEGSALREGSLGRKYGLNMFMSQNAPSVAAGNTTVTPDVNGAQAAGTTDLVVDGGVTVVAGSWCTVEGDDTPQLITAVDADPATQLTLDPGLRHAVDDDAVVTVYSPGAVDLVAGYAAGYTKALTVDGFTVAPKNGQLVSFKAAGAYKYGLLPTPSITSMLLNRATDEALANNDVAAIGPMGEYGLAFHRDAIALVTRPLALPMSGTGAAAAVASGGGLSVRVVITYDGAKQGHLVTVDILCGVKTLNTSLGVPLIS